MAGARSLSVLRAATFCFPIFVQIDPSYSEYSRNSSDPCAEFTLEAKRYWTLEECRNVWADWEKTIDRHLRREYPDRSLVRRFSVELRRRGRPCVVEAADPYPDGVGSEFTRHLAAWLYATEVGCDWITPRFGYRNKTENDYAGGPLYCHDSATLKEFEGLSESERNIETCELVDWLQYFNLGEPSITLPQARFYNVTGARDSESLKKFVDDIERLGLDIFPNDVRLRFTFAPGIPSVYVVATKSWDQYKREITRHVLSQMRKNFYRYPRPWFDRRPDCGYSTTELNFAMHLRTGDRTAIQGDLDEEYFNYLHRFMDTVTEAVITKGLDSPLFHIYTQTLDPCPSVQTRIFEGFPFWRVVDDEIALCVNTSMPDDCPEKRSGAKMCNTNRPNIFRVQGRPLILHVGQNVQECLACMIDADGVLMGCSTFGQIAGWLSRGLRFFSVGCKGKKTLSQYQMSPPLAIADRGNMYVPISGSWRNPQVMFPSILQRMLDHLPFR